MTRAEADILIEGFYAANGTDGEPSAQNPAGAQSVGTRLYFSYDAAEEMLKAGALIAQFSAPPTPEFLTACVMEIATNDAPTGGGILEYQTANGGLYLSQIYRALSDITDFNTEMRELLSAALTWQTEILERAVLRAAAN